jgi:hypothetical protein
MNRKLIPNIFLIIGLAAPPAALVESVTYFTSNSVGSPSLVQRLEEQARLNELSAKSWSQEPIVQQDYYVQARECRGLIAKLSAGEAVSNAALAQALRPVDTPY